MYMPVNPDLPFLYGMVKGTVGERREGSGFACAPGESGGGECGEDKPHSSCHFRPAGDAIGLFAQTPSKLGANRESHAERRESSGFTCARRKSGEAEGGEDKPHSSAGL